MQEIVHTPRPAEPLNLSAPLARRLALQLCRADPATGKSCAWLHGFWQCLRILELAADPGRHAAFYRDALRAGAASRILVSGAADYSMLAHAIEVFRESGSAPQITVIDTCETPLELNRWYAERAACRIATQRCSILDYAPQAAFELVCTHSFFGMFAPADRPRLIASWRRVLRPGGRLVTAHPLRPWGPDEPNRFSPEQAESFRATVSARAAELAGLLGTSAQDVMQQAEGYLGARYGYPVRSLDELRALFVDGGFDLVHLESVLPGAGAPREAGGPGLRNSKVHYAHIIARRR